MSVIGPRPGLWNQDILTAERDKYNANDVKPGLTGWAQINGRDELEIPDKAKLDGEYVSKMGLRALMKFSIITVCLNAGENLIETVKSTLMQTYADFEIIVKDGFSDDGSIDRLPQDSRIKLVQKKDSGIYEAMNQGIKEA